MTSGGVPFGGNGTQAERAETLFDAVGDGLHLRVRASGTNQEVVCQRGVGVDIEKQKIVRLLFQGVANAQQRGFAGFQRRHPITTLDTVGDERCTARREGARDTESIGRV